MHPNSHKSFGGWSQASERHKVPLEMKAGRYLLRGGASVVVESGLKEKVRSIQTKVDVFHGNIIYFSRNPIFTAALPPGCLCEAGISVPLLPPVGHRSYR